MSRISQTSTYTMPGTYTYVVPAGVSSVEIHLWGAGGADGLSGANLSRQIGTQASGSRVIGQTQSGSQVVGQRIVQTGTSEIVIPGGSQTYSTAGSYVAVLPAGVKTARVTATGGTGASATETVARNGK